MRKQLWFACVVCVAATVPGFLVGWLAAVLYSWQAISWLGNEPDFWFMRTLFGIEAPGKILGWLLISAFPEFIHAGVAGGIAVLLTQYAYKGPRLDLAAFVTGDLYTGIAVMAGFLSYVMHGPSLDMVLIVIEAVGLWAGLLSVADLGASRGGWIGKSRPSPTFKEKASSLPKVENK